VEAKKNIFLTVVGTVLIVFMFYIVFGTGGLVDLHKKRIQIAEAVKSNEQLNEENKALYNDVKRLRHDEDYIEQVARKELGMIKEHEYIVKLSTNKPKK
jgi:cell division protein FtsB